MYNRCYYGNWNFKGQLMALKPEKNQWVELHWPGIEPGPPAWQARILPLNHQCFRVHLSYAFFLGRPCGCLLWVRVAVSGNAMSCGSDPTKKTPILLCTSTAATHTTKVETKGRKLSVLRLKGLSSLSGEQKNSQDCARDCSKSPERSSSIALTASFPSIQTKGFALLVGQILDNYLDHYSA